MSILNQKTLNDTLEYKGIGLHTGKNSDIRILPAEPNTGIVFKRTDLKEFEEELKKVKSLLTPGQVGEA